MEKSSDCDFVHSGLQCFNRGARRDGGVFSILYFIASALFLSYLFVVCF